MGSDAVVFRNFENMERLFGKGNVELVDAATGEVDVLPNGAPLKDRVAEDRRIGNIATLVHLRELAELLLGKSSFAESRALSNGYPSDVIAVVELPDLQRDLETLRGSDDTYMKQFVESMDLLILAAKMEGNPIYFL